MLLDISEILRTVGSSFTFRLNENDLELGALQLASPVGGEIIVSNTSSRLLVRGSAWGDVVLQCGRCLQPFIYPVDAEIEEDFEMAQVQRLASRQRLDDVTMQALFTGAAINLNELLLQEFTLNLPISPLCSAECDPICPKCGRAQSRCRCEPGSEIDARWLPLLDKLKREC